MFFSITHLILINILIDAIGIHRLNNFRIKFKLAFSYSFCEKKNRISNKKTTTQGMRKKSYSYYSIVQYKTYRDI